MGNIRIDGTSFNTDWVSSFTSVSEFITSCPPHIFEGENREAKLTELYTIVNGKPKSKVKSKDVIVDELDSE